MSYDCYKVEVNYEKVSIQTGNDQTTYKHRNCQQSSVTTSGNQTTTSVPISPNDQDLINNLQASLIFAPASNLVPIGES